MRPAAYLLISLIVLAGFWGPVHAASLRVAPVLLDLRAPTAASAIRVWNDAAEPINVQARVFRWSQRGGEDVYEPTDTVVVSPPITTLQPGGENLIRVVRVSKAPVRAEESYRLIVDELPDPVRTQANMVNLVVRHSIPVFFGAADAGTAKPIWSIIRQQGGFRVVLRNEGSRRLRISNMTLSAGGSTIGSREGLLGYALGHSSAEWFLPSDTRARSAETVEISAESDAGPIHATVRLTGR